MIFGFVAMPADLVLQFVYCLTVTNNLANDKLIFNSEFKKVL